MTIKQLRMALGLTQEEIAKRLDISPYTYHRWECGKNIPSPKYIQSLARELRVSPTIVVKALYKNERR